MTTANLLNVSPVKSVQVDVSKRLQEEAQEVTEIFASMMMNHSVDVVSQGGYETSSEIGMTGTDEITNSYERFSYQDKQIENAQDKGVTTDYADAEEALQAAEEEIVSTLSEEYGVDEETLHNLLDEMGLTVLDLLNPQNLVSFVMALTGLNAGEELLLDESFLKVMEALDTLSNNLMKELNVDRGGLRDIIAMMENVDVEGTDIAFEQVLENQMELTDLSETGALQEDVAGDEAILTAETDENQTVTSQTTAADGTETTEEVRVEMKGQEEQQDTANTKGDTANQEEMTETPNREAGTDTQADANLFDNQNRGTDSNHVFMTNQTTTVPGQFSEMPQMQLNSYMSVDTIQIMEQLAEQIRVIATPDTTSMEMQLNPENLGKIYLHISAEEGVVNAQFTATNEVVKEALESQIAVLRENLTQAGVKVDAIEVTIASHEFERNLEQNQKQAEEQIQDEPTTKRRNLSLDSLDELQGIMTEEETLVAQIMRDNGNSVDFTA